MHADMRCFRNGRLEYHRSRPAGEEFWGSHWREHFSADTYRGYDQGSLGQHNAIFDAILPRHGLILEAGCGMGQLVMGLNRRGFSCEGVEYSLETVERVKELHPDLPIRHGDVTALDVPDGHYAALLSLGVVEHRPEGPEPYLAEAWRVLAPGGTAFISVPWLNPLRRFKAGCGAFRGSPGSGHRFYQYAFSRRELGEFLTRAGFEVLRWHPYGGWKGLADELPGLKSLLSKGLVTRHHKACLNRHPFVLRLAGHMIAAICRKPGASS